MSEVELEFLRRENLRLRMENQILRNERRIYDFPIFTSIEKMDIVDVEYTTLRLKKVASWEVGHDLRTQQFHLLGKAAGSRNNEFRLEYYIEDPLLCKGNDLLIYLAEMHKRVMHMLVDNWSA